MPTFQHGDVTIYYEEHGSGFPVLLIAPGGMRSAVSFWRHAPWNPIEQLSSRYRVIAMDQRNAGRSTAPVRATDGWARYTGDQLALLDHLGVDRFHVAGMCIGGSYITALIDAAPERVASGVVFQTIGLDDNRNAFYEMFDSWADELGHSHPEADDAGWKRFRDARCTAATTSCSVSRRRIARVPDAAAGAAGQRHVPPAVDVPATWPPRRPTPRWSSAGRTPEDHPAARRRGRGSSWPPHTPGG